MDVKSREEIIKFAQKLNKTNLSPLRSGNISVRGVEDGIEGFFITPLYHPLVSACLKRIHQAAYLLQEFFLRFRY